MKHYITAFVAHGFGDDEIFKTTDTYGSLEHAESVLSTILKNKLSQNWEITAFSNEDLEEVQGNIISMVQGKNSSRAMAVIWAVHSDPEPVTKNGEMLPNYVNQPENARDYSTEDYAQPDINEDYYYAGMIAINLDTSLTGMIGEQTESLADAEERFAGVLDEAKAQGATIGEIAENTKDGAVLKEVLIVGGHEANIIFISNKELTVERFRKQIDIQLFAHENLKDMIATGNNTPSWLGQPTQKSLFDQAVSWVFTHPIASIIIVALALMVVSN